MSIHRDHKCVIILQSGLPLGFATNAAAVLAISIGQRRPDIVAEDLVDGSGDFHAGLVNVPVPLLQASPDDLKRIRDAALKNTEVLVVDFSEPARTARSFETYRDLLASTKREELQYVGVALFGHKKAVSSFTEGLSLLK